MKAVEYVCIVCPRSCRGKVLFHEDGSIKGYQGFSCPRGEAYARGEHTLPQRLLTSTVAVDGADLRRLPVVSSREISKTLLADCHAYLRQVRVTAPVPDKSVVVSNILGSGADIIAAREIRRSQRKEEI